MAGFRSVKYEGDDGEIYLLRMRVDLLEAIEENTEPAGEVTKEWHLETSNSPKAFGLKPRFIVATRSFTVGTDTATKRIRVPILRPDKIEGDPPAIPIGSVFTYAGKSWAVASLNGEDNN